MNSFKVNTLNFLLKVDNYKNSSKDQHLNTAHAVVLKLYLELHEFSSIG